MEPKPLRLISTIFNETVVACAYSDGSYTISETGLSDQIQSDYYWQPSSQEALNGSRAILNAALYAAQSNASRAQRLNLSIQKYMLTLVINYHTTCATPKFFRVSARKLRNNSKEKLAIFFEKKIQEESNHSNLALSDITDLGGGIETTSYIPQRAKSLISFLQIISEIEDPIECLGYAFTLERLALFVDENAINNIKNLLGPKLASAIRCVTAHSRMGTEVLHVEELITEVSKCDYSEVQRIANAAYQTMAIMSSYCEDEDLDAEQISLLLNINNINVY